MIGVNRRARRMTFSTLSGVSHYSRWSQAFTKLYVQQYGSRGLRMNNVLPGKIDTYPVSAEAVRQIPLARPGTADDVARLVAFLLSDDAAYILARTSWSMAA